MKVTAKIVKKVYELAHLSQNPTEQEIKQSTKDLQKIVDLVTELDEIDTDNVNVFASSRTNRISDLRADIPNNNISKYEATATKIRASFPLRQGNFLVLDKRIIQDS